jgi:hypothetical protein
MAYRQDYNDLVLCVVPEVVLKVRVELAQGLMRYACGSEIHYANRVFHGNL